MEVGAVCAHLAPFIFQGVTHSAKGQPYSLSESMPRPMVKEVLLVRDKRDEDY